MGELVAFDKLVIRMSLGGIVQNRITLRFEYMREQPDGGLELVARGEQQVACMMRHGDELVPTQIPEKLRDALRKYAD